MEFPGAPVPCSLLQFWCMMITDASYPELRIKVNLVCLTLNVIINSCNLKNPDTIYQNKLFKNVVI